MENEMKDDIDIEKKYRTVLKIIWVACILFAFCVFVIALVYGII
jgi:hypothetical protein